MFLSLSQKKNNQIHILLFNYYSQEMFSDLGDLLCTLTGFDSFSLQPNAGAAGEYAGLMVIRAYHMVQQTVLVY